jgi:hypothetical protein
MTKKSNKLRITAISEITKTRPAEKPESKKQIVLKMLNEGVTIKQIMEATGWQKHTVHGTIANLKKKENLVITSEKIGNDKIYKTNS